MDKIIYKNQIEYLRGFKKTDDKLVCELEKYAAENKIPILHWQAAELLEIMIKSVSPRRVLEIGTAIGYSTIRIARNLGKNGVIHTIEKSEDNIKVAENNFSQSGFKHKIALLKGDALEIMPRLPKKYDFIFLDADKQDYSRLFDYSLILLKKGGVIFIDNLLWHGYTAADRVPNDFSKSTKIIRDFNNIFMNQPNLKATILTVGDGIGIGIKVKNKKNKNDEIDNIVINETNNE